MTPLAWALLAFFVNLALLIAAARWARRSKP